MCHVKHISCRLIIELTDNICLHSEKQNKTITMTMAESVNFYDRFNFQKNVSITENQRRQFLFINKNICNDYDQMSVTNIQWPTSWSSTDKHSNIELSSNLLQAHYIGSDSSHASAGSIRSDVPIPISNCSRPIYYYEAKILDCGKSSFIGIGLSGMGSSLYGLPGWRQGSYGYHGDDGKKFARRMETGGMGKRYAETFTTNDVIGCGLNVFNGSCFFTKNGICLGLAFSKLCLDTPWYPVIGMNSPEEKIEANFGSQPFMYNIELENILQEAHAKDVS